MNLKSIKPGRGPSMMSGVMCIIVGIFGVIWTIGAVSMGAGPIFALFGLVFIGVAVVNAVYNFKNATSKDRFSVYDITESHEEGDPFDKYYKTENSDAPQNDETESNFCPYCGTKVQEAFEYCNKCGKKLP